MVFVRRYLVALVSIMAAVPLAGRFGAHADTLLWPKQPPTFFAVTVPPNWTVKQDDIGLAEYSQDECCSVYVSGAANVKYVVRSTNGLAAEMAKAIGMTGFAGPEPATISGVPAQRYSGTVQSQSGNTPVDIKMLIVRLAPSALVFVRIMAPKGITPAQQSALDQAVAGVALVGKH
jgi:hypothetical protein